VLRYQEGWSACSGFLTDTLFSTSEETDFYIGTDCNLAPSTQQWRDDPCCNWEASFDQCCGVRTIDFNETSYTPDTASIRSFCVSNVECIESFASDYQQRVFEQTHSRFGCTAILSNALVQEADQLSKLQACSINAFKTDQAAGYTCDSDDDCPTGSLCNIVTRLCNVTLASIERQYVNCLFGEESPFSLFVVSSFATTAGLTNLLPGQALVNEVLTTDVFQVEDCVSEYGLGVATRTHFQLIDASTVCYDNCEQEVRCIEDSCNPPSDCQLPWSHCERHWFKVPSSPKLCNNEITCNWIEDCTQKFGFKGCIERCQNTQDFNKNFCAYCTSDDACVEIFAESQEECEQIELCVTIDDVVRLRSNGPNAQEECFDEGFCSLDCPKFQCNPEDDDLWDGLCVYTGPNALDISREQCQQFPKFLRPEFERVWANGRWVNLCYLEALDDDELCGGESSLAPNFFSWQQCQGLEREECSLCSGGDFSPECPLHPAFRCYNSETGECNTRAECEAAGRCSDRDALENDWEFPPIQGACVLPFRKSLFEPESLCHEWQYATTFGCIDYDVTSQQECDELVGEPDQSSSTTRNTGKWIRPTTTKDQCESYNTKCTEFFAGVTLKNTTECKECEGTPLNAYDWESGVWYTSSKATPKWIERKIVKTAEWKSVLDIEKVTTSLRSAIAREVSYSGRSATMCELFPIRTVLDALTCDCTKKDPQTFDPEASTCFDDTIDLLTGVGKPCPLQQYDLIAPPIYITFFSNSIDFDATADVANLCPDVLIASRSALQYRTSQQAPLSSLFTRVRTQEDFSVINEDIIEVGQVLGDGVVITRVSDFDDAINSSATQSDIQLKEDDDDDENDFDQSTDEQENFLNQQRSTIEKIYSNQQEQQMNHQYSTRNHILTTENNDLIANNIQVCIQIRSDLVTFVNNTIQPRRSDFVVYDFAKIYDGDRLVPLGLSNMTLVKEDDIFLLCTILDHLYYGESFFPALRVENFEDEEDPLFEDWELAILYLTASFYFIVLIFCCYRLAQLAYYRQLISDQTIFPGFLAIFNTFRGVYFVLLGTETLENVSTYVNFVLIDVPYLFYFTGMTLLLWWWVSLAWTKDRTNLTRNFRVLTIGSAAVILSILVLVLVLYSVLEEDDDTVICGGRIQAEQKDITDQEILLITYKAVLCGVTFIGCIGFFVSGYRLRKMALHRVERRVTFITGVAVVSFLFQSAYFIVLAATTFSEQVESVIPLWFIEVLPQLAMLYLQNPTGRRTKRSSSSSSSGRDQKPRSRTTTGTDDSSGQFSGTLYDGTDDRDSF